MKFTTLAPLSILAMATNFSTQQPVIACPNGEIVPELLAWVSPIPIAQAHALPPEEPPAPIPSSTDHTHVLHMELRLHNTTRDTHTAEVLKANWSQNGHTHLLTWHKQPDLSPLNRFNTIEHRPIQGDTTQPLTVTLKLTIDGKSCTLSKVTSVPVRME